MNAINEDAVCDEIVAAFQDVPRPDRCAPEDFVAYDEAEDLEYLVGKTWLDIATDVTYMTRHCEDQFYYMTDECFLYLLPGYLLGTVKYDFALVEGVVSHLLIVLSLAGCADELLPYLSDGLTLSQKRAVAHWLQLQLEREKERHPEVYECADAATAYTVVLERWRQWA